MIKVILPLVLMFASTTYANNEVLELEADLTPAVGLTISSGEIAAPEGFKSALIAIPKCVLINQELQTVKKGTKFTIDLNSKKETVIKRSYNPNSKEGKIIESLVDGVLDLGGIPYDGEFSLNISRYDFSASTVDGKKMSLICEYRSGRSAEEIQRRIISPYQRW